MEFPNTDGLKKSYVGITDKQNNVIVAHAQASGIYDCLSLIMIDNIISP